MDLQIQQNERFQRREWRVERVAWVLVALVVVGGLVGLLGRGPFSWTSGRGAAGLVEVEYQRIGHLEADDRLGVTVEGAAVTEDSVSVVLDQEWVDAVDINSIVPEPDTQIATAQGLELVVSTTPGTQVEVQISYRATAIGPVHGGASVSGDRADFTQFIFP